MAASLKWHGKDGDYKACASALYPEDSFPPIYLIVRAGMGAERIVKLLRGEPGHRTVENIGGKRAPNLAEAKVVAQKHYDRRAKVTC